jgi:hypothetical protein
MAVRSKTKPGSARRRPDRHTVSLPPSLAFEVRRVAKERHLPISRVLVELAELGVQAELDARKRLESSFNQFLGASDPASKNKAGRDLIRSIFGNDSIAEDSVF